VSPPRSSSHRPALRAAFSLSCFGILLVAALVLDGFVLIRLVLVSFVSLVLVLVRLGLVSFGLVSFGLVVLVLSFGGFVGGLVLAAGSLTRHGSTRTTGDLLTGLGTVTTDLARLVLEASSERLRFRTHR